MQAIETREPVSGILARYTEVAALLIGREGVTAQDGVKWIGHVCDELNIPGLSRYGVEAGGFSELIEGAERSSSMRGNPISLTHAEMRLILESAL